MRTNAINITRQPIKRTGKYNAPVHSATMVASVLGTSTALSWATSPKTMAEVVQNCGGMRKYLQKYLLGLAAFSAIGAGIAGTSELIADKLTTGKKHKSPKAVN